MRFFTKLVKTVHLVVLGVWLGGLMMTATVAAIVFPLMIHTIKPTLPEFALYTGSHGMLAAGQVATRVFWAFDAIQLNAAIISLATLVLLIVVLKQGGTRYTQWLRIVGVGGACVCVGIGLMVLRPAMDGHLRAYWQAAQAGENESAEEHRIAFSDMHPSATRLMGATGIFVLLGLASGIWAISEPARTRQGKEMRDV